MENPDNTTDIMSMSVRERNRRLYATLMNMGITVLPVFNDYETPEIRSISHFIVSCGDGGILAEKLSYPQSMIGAVSTVRTSN